MAALTVIQKFFALALKPDMREITPWIMFRCAILRSTSLSGFVVLDIGECFSGGRSERHISVIVRESRCPLLL